MTDETNIPVRQTVDPVRRVVVVGAGIAGLTVGYYLNKMGYDVRVYERAKAVGGMLRTSWQEDSYLIELGPQPYFISGEHLASLSRELSLDRLELRDTVQDRFIYWGGALRRVPTGPLSLAGTRLLTIGGRTRALVEPLVRSKSFEGETVADFVRRRAGQEVLDALVNPLITSAWKGDPEQLEIKSCLPKACDLEDRYGSVVRGLSRERGSLRAGEIMSYRWGMGTLSARLEEVLRRKTRLGWTIEGVTLDQEGRLFVTTADPDRRSEADAVVVATGAQSAGKIVEKLAPTASQFFNAVPYCPLVVVHMAFDRSAVGGAIRGREVLVPRAAQIRLLGTVFTSEIFPGRAPERKVLLTNFIGGATDVQAMDLDDAEVIKEVRRGLYAVTGITAKPTFVKVVRLVRAIPQYTVGHLRAICEVERELEKVPGVFITGNYFSGVSVSDTIGHARKTAEDVRAWLRRPRIRTLGSFSSEHS